MQANNKVALVTGGGRGIGKAIALRLAEDGADVAINYFRNRKPAEETARAIEALGRRTQIIKANVGDLDELDGMIQTVNESLGGLDIVAVFLNQRWNMRVGQVSFAFNAVLFLLIALELFVLELSGRAFAAGVVLIAVVILAATLARAVILFLATLGACATAGVGVATTGWVLAGIAAAVVLTGTSRGGVGRPSAWLLGALAVVIVALAVLAGRPGLGPGAGVLAIVSEGPEGG